MRPSEQAVALFTNVFGYEPDPEALNAGECWQVERIDAALRAAKVEELERVQSRFRKDGIALTLTYLQYRIAELGRSAQIEEGE
jgi:hypothetical protein